MIERLVPLLEKKDCTQVQSPVTCTGMTTSGGLLLWAFPAFNANTGKECHLDAHLVEHAIDHLPLDDIDILFIENVGNMVCPTDFRLEPKKGSLS